MHIFRNSAPKFKKKNRLVFPLTTTFYDFAVQIEISLTKKFAKLKMAMMLSYMFGLFILG